MLMNMREYNIVVMEIRGVILVGIMVMIGDIQVLMMATRGAIGVLMMTNVDLGLKRPATLPLAILGKVLLVIGEVHICLIPSTIPTITHVTW